MGSARLRRASSGVAPELSFHTIFGIPGAKKFAGRCFRRDAENHMPEACAPQTSPLLPYLMAVFGLKAVLVFSGRCGRRPRCNSFLSFQSLIRTHSFHPGGDPFSHPSGRGAAWMRGCPSLQVWCRPCGQSPMFWRPFSQPHLRRNETGGNRLARVGTVVDKPESGLALIDAGSKTFSSGKTSAGAFASAAAGRTST